MEKEGATPLFFPRFFIEICTAFYQSTKYEILICSFIGFHGEFFRLMQEKNNE
jgi:hypothetical protein